MIYFVSFGSDGAYEELSYQVLRGLSVGYPQSFYRIYTASDLPRALNEYAQTYRRGYGYWTWKPWIVLRTLNMLVDGDILLYVDGRCDLVEFGKPIRWLNEFVESVQFDLAAWQMGYVEKHWTTQDLISRIAGKDHREVAETGQLAATFHAWRVNKRARKLAEHWLNFLIHNPSLCRDNPSLIPNDSNFKENRHDQSVFSLLVKVLQRRSLLSVSSLNESQIRSDNLLPHRKKHPVRKLIEP